MDEANGNIFRIDSYLFPNYEDNETVTVNIDIIVEGTFTFVILAMNSFGSSLGCAAINGISIIRGMNMHVLISF